MPLIRQMTYEPPERGAAPVEVMTFDRLRALNDGGTQRAEFHVLAIVDRGAGSVTVDFVTHSLTPRTMVWIAPGSVHRWNETDGVVGHLVLFVPTAPVTRRTRELVVSPDLSARWMIPTADWPFVDTARKHLVLEAAAVGADSASEVPEILLSALIARVAPPQAHPRSTNGTFQMFQSSVEAHFRQHHDAGYYARGLGFAPRTLTRAVQQVVGCTAKAYIVDRLVLEAKRLLAHDQITAARCAQELGFPDASNFSLFFQNATGDRPGAWQKKATAHAEFP